jgi:hypothetical protein
VEACFKNRTGGSLILEIFKYAQNQRIFDFCESFLKPEPEAIKIKIR